MEYKQLNNGIKMPVLGLGVCRIDDLKECEEVVMNAMNTGYRLIDTAEIYENEEAVGKAIQRSGVSRDELFITSKLWINHNSYEGAWESLRESLKKLQLEYIDMYMIHWPIGDYYGAYHALEEAYEQGLIRAIGVSNFHIDQLYDLLQHCKIKPVINQIQCHPFMQKDTEIAFMQDNDIVVEAYSPFAVGQNNIFEQPVLKEIASKYKKSVAQVILRWNIERGVIAIPKSVHVERMKQNLDVFDFSLDEEDMNQIRTINTQDFSDDEIRRMKSISKFF